MIGQRYICGSRYYSLCAVSGFAWGGIAYYLGHPWPPCIWGGILASPLIGLVVGLAYLPAYRFRVGFRILLALVALYIAVALFGIALGICDQATRYIPNQIRGAGVIESLLATLWGVTFTGYVLFLWPLAYWNYWVLGRASAPRGMELHGDSTSTESGTGGSN